LQEVNDETELTKFHMIYACGARTLSYLTKYLRQPQLSLTQITLGIYLDLLPIVEIIEGSFRLSAMYNVSANVCLASINKALLEE
jgi:hypothetical protein